MPRPKRCRWVGFNPDITYFKPSGIKKMDLEESILTVDEFEAIRLKDLLGRDQIEAAKSMNISQPTFHRLVLSARKKIADAINYISKNPDKAAIMGCNGRKAVISKYNWIVEEKKLIDLYYSLTNR